MKNINNHIVELLDEYNFSERLKVYSCVYIYGAGYVGQAIYDYLVECGNSESIKGFLTTDRQNITIKGLHVYPINKKKIDEDGLVVLAAKRSIRAQLKQKCEELKINNYMEVPFFDDERDYTWYSSLPEEVYPTELKDWYKNCTGQDLNLTNPRTFNDVINWSKIYDTDPRRTEYADKYLVREYVKEKLGEKYLIPIYGVWEKFADIDFDKLPRQFVLKCTHGSGWNLIVKDKGDLNLDDAEEKFNTWMRMNYTFVCGYELHYGKIKPRIIAEKYISELDDNLVDYKVHCFNGKPKFIQVIGNRDYEKHTAKQAIYDFDWNEREWCFDDYPKYEYILKKPIHLDELYEVSEKLCSGFKYVRVDLYELPEILFGELTFTPGSGIYKYIENYKDCDAVRLRNYILED